MTKKRATAASWRTRPMPEETAVLPVDGSYSRAEYVQLSMGFIPQSQADKWFIYLEGEWLNIHRSATGTAVFQLQIVPQDDHYQATQAIVNRNEKQYRSTGDEYDVQLMSYLIDTLIFGRFAPMPMPKGAAKGDNDKYRQHIMGKKDDGAISLTDLLNNGHN